AWLSGSLVAVTALALAGFPAHVPDALRRAVFLLLGISMGTAVTPETIAGIRTWPITMALLVLSLPGTMAAVMLYLRWTGWDRESVLYASAPGAMSSVLALASAAGADVRKVAFAQSVRVFLLIVALPGIFGWLGLIAPETSVAPPPIAIDHAWEIALMAASGIAAGLIADRLGVPGGLIVGSMAASAVLHGTGYVEARVPQYALVPCFVLLGAFIGARFVGTDLAMVRRLFVDSIGAFVVAVVVSTIFAVAAVMLSGEGAAKTILAFAPGGLEAMIILAFLIGLDPAFVGAHHIVRFLLIALFLPLVARLLFGKPAKTQ
ncbi:MAG: AbrB family transcriptional regulator, partial [Xanthobacteraceae bacterium]